MIFVLKYWRILSLLGMLAGSFIWGYATGADRVQRKWDAEKVAALQEVERAKKENEATITKLTETKNENLAIIDAMRTDLMRLRVRLPKTTCPGSMPDTAPAAGGVLQATGTGYASTPAQTAFDRFAVGLGEDAAVNSYIIENCRVVMEWAKNLETTCLFKN